jgi:type II secretory pathway pseudopilin PulG
MMPAARLVLPLPLVRNRGGAGAGIDTRRLFGLTLTEMLVVTGVVGLLLLLAVEGGQAALERAAWTRCAGRLRQLGLAFTAYRAEYRAYPAFAPPRGLGDLHNWGDLWRGSDPLGGALYFPATPSEVPGVLEGNRTHTPRVPRLLVEYAGQIEVLHCPAMGGSATWPDVGPYRYNTTSPFAGGHALWKPLAASRRGRGREPLAACQVPFGRAIHHGTWRHGVRAHADPGGRNQHLYAGGHVRMFVNPEDWDAEETE